MSVKRPKRANRTVYGSEDVEKMFCFFIYSYFFTAVKRDTKFLTGYVKGESLILSEDGIQKGYLSCQK